MKKITLILLLLSGMAQAQSSLLYEISGNGIKHKSYLFGTVHVQEERAFNFNDSVYYAIQQSNKSAFELDFNFKKSDLDLDTAKLEKLGNYVIEDLIPTIMETYPADTLANKITTTFAPVFQMVMKQQFTMGNKRREVIDQYLQNYSRTIGNEIIGIETYKEQFEALLGGDFTGFTDMVIDLLDSDDLLSKIENTPGNANKLVDSYSALDFDALCSEIEAVGDATNPFATAFYGRVFTDRNQIMFDRTKEMVKEGPIFIAVGCGHLCGSNGLVQQYRDAGYTVRAIDISGKTDDLDVVWKTEDDENFSVDLPSGYERFKKEEAPVETDEETVTEAVEEDFFSMYTRALANQEIYTSKGKLSIDISELYEVEAADEMSYDWGSFDDEGNVDEGDYDDGIEEEIYYEDVESAGEPIDEADYMEYSEEAIEVEEYDEDEVVYYEQVEEPADAIEEDYDSEDGEAMEYNRAPRPSDFKERFTPEMKTYMEKVGKSISAEMAGQTMGLMAFAMMAKPEKDTFNVKIMGEDVEVHREFSLLRNSMSCDVYSDKGNYTITISGDPAALRSEETLRILTSFKIK